MHSRRNYADCASDMRACAYWRFTKCCAGNLLVFILTLPRQRRDHRKRHQHQRVGRGFRYGRGDKKVGGNRGVDLQRTGHANAEGIEIGVGSRVRSKYPVVGKVGRRTPIRAGGDLDAARSAGDGAVEELVHVGGHVLVLISGNRPDRVHEGTGTGHEPELADDAIPFPARGGGTVAKSDADCTRHQLTGGKTARAIAYLHAEQYVRNRVARSKIALRRRAATRSRTFCKLGCARDQPQQPCGAIYRIVIKENVGACSGGGVWKALNDTDRRGVTRHGHT